MHSLSGTGPPRRAGRKEWAGLAVLALPTLLLSLDAGVLYLAGPQLARDLGADATQLLWITDIYGFMIAGFLVTMGALGDRIGRRRLLLIGAAAFGAVSLAVAYAPSAEVLIAARALLGIAGATLMPSTLALISSMFADARQRAVAVTVWMSCFMGGTAAGPIVGGVLLEHFWWGSVFLLGVPVTALLLVLAPPLVPEHRQKDAARIDALSVLLSVAAVLPLVYGLKETAKHGAGPVEGLAVLAGLALGAAFVARQRRLAQPLVEPALFSNRAFSAALGMLLLGGLAYGLQFLITQHLQLVLGLSPLDAGLWLIPPTLAMILGAQLAPRLSRRIRPGHVIAGGMLAAAAGYAVITQSERLGGTSALLAGFIVVSAGTGPLTALSTDLVIGAAPTEKAGSAASLAETSGELGIALGIAALGSTATAVYGARLELPDGTPEQAARAAREGIAGAVDAVRHLPGETGEALLRSARGAFTGGLQLSAALTGLLALAIAAIALTVFRDVPAHGAPHRSRRRAPRSGTELHLQPEKSRKKYRQNSNNG